MLNQIARGFEMQVMTAQSTPIPPIAHIQLNNYMSAAVGGNDKDIKIKADAIMDLQKLMSSSKGREELIDVITSFTDDSEVKRLITQSINQGIEIGFSNPPLNTAGPIAYSVNPQFEQDSLDKRLHYAAKTSVALLDNDPKKKIIQQCIKELKKPQSRLDSSISGFGSRVVGAFEIAGNAISGRTENRELHRAAVDMVLSSCLPNTIEIGGCQSGKDRYGALVVTADTYKAYAQKYESLPPAFGTKQFQQLDDEKKNFLNTTFAEHWLSGYRQDVADRNTPGASGLKNNSEILTNDQRKAIREGIAEKIKEAGGSNFSDPDKLLEQYISGKIKIDKIKERGFLMVAHLEAFDPEVSHELSNLNKHELKEEEILSIRTEMSTDTNFLPALKHLPTHHGDNAEFNAPSQTKQEGLAAKSSQMVTIEADNENSTKPSGPSH